MDQLFMGVKEGARTVLTAALQNALTNDFWNSLSPQQQYVDPTTIVISDYPTERTRFPFVHLHLDLTDPKVLTVNHGGATQTGSDTHSAGCKANIRLDIYALNPLQRDRLADAYTSLFMFRDLCPSNNVFDQTLQQMAQQNPYIPLVQVEQHSLTFNMDDDGETAPWSNQQYIYATSLSVQAKVYWTFTASDSIQLINQINSNGTLDPLSWKEDIE
ncbi:MAG: hypothetical protein J5965_23290 [Aeriscardovia sp.]|nr:hypothetical protein [Aeriscardovia sp.]